MPPPPPDPRLRVTRRLRGPARLDQVEAPGAVDPPLGALRDAAGDAGRLTLAGGEPTLRADLPALISALGAGRDLGLHTDGLALSQPRVLRGLAAAGLRRLRVDVYAARRDAHDWLAGRPGGLRRVTRAIAAARAAGLAVEAEVVVTRPAAAHLAETVRFLGRLGVGRARLRRLLLRGPARAAAVALSPRLGRLQHRLEEAVLVGGRVGVEVTLHGFPACAAGGAAPARVPPGDEPWLGAPPPLAGARCAACPRAPGGGGRPAGLRGPLRRSGAAPRRPPTRRGRRGAR